jgi:branched-chain amino acid transport system permease protein
MRKSILLGVVGLALLVAVPPFLKNYGIYLISYWLIFVIANMGLNLTIGYAGRSRRPCSLLRHGGPHRGHP